MQKGESSGAFALDTFPHQANIKSMYISFYFLEEMLIRNIGERERRGDHNLDNLKIIQTGSYN